MSIVFRDGEFVGANESFEALEKEIAAAGVVAKFYPHQEFIDEVMKDYVDSTDLIEGSASEEDAMLYGDDLQVGPAEVLDGDERDGEAEEPILSRIEQQMLMNDKEFLASVNNEYYLTEAPADDGVSMEVVSGKFRTAFADRGVGYNSWGGDALTASIDAMAAVAAGITKKSYEEFMGLKNMTEADKWVAKYRLELLEGFYERMPVEVFTGSALTYWFTADKKDKAGNVVINEVTGEPEKVDIMRGDAGEDFITAMMAAITGQQVTACWDKLVDGEVKHFERTVTVPMPMDVSYEAQTAKQTKIFTWSPWRDIRTFGMHCDIDVDMEGEVFSGIPEKALKKVQKKMKAFMLDLLESLDKGPVDLENVADLIKATNDGKSYIPAIMSVWMSLAWKTNAYYYAMRKAVSFVANRMNGYIQHRKAYENIKASEADYLIMDANKLMKTDNREWEGWQGPEGRKTWIAAYNALDNWTWGQEQKKLNGTLGRRQIIYARIDGCNILSVRTGCVLGVIDENDEIVWNLRNNRDVKIIEG